MKYIVFENTENYEDSIVLIADKNIKTIENPDNNIKAGYGNYKIHEPSGGLVFDNLRLLRHFFEGARDVFGEGDSCYGSPTDDEKMKRKTMTCFIYEFLTASHIKKEMELEGGLNVGLYYIEDDQDSETYNSYLDYINSIERDLHLKKIEKGDSMKQVTFKLTNPELKSLWPTTSSKTLTFFRLLECCDKNKTHSHYECEVFDVDKFRDFLNNKMSAIETEQKASDYIDRQKIDTLVELRIVLSKLNDAVIDSLKKPKMNHQYWLKNQKKRSNKLEEGKVYALTGGPNDKCVANGDSWEDCVVQNDEPKEKLFDVEFMDGICQKNIVCTWERLGQIKIEKPYIVKFKIKEKK